MGISRSYRALSRNSSTSAFPKRRIIFFISPDPGSARRGKLSSPHTPWEQLFVAKPLVHFFH